MNSNKSPIIFPTYLESICDFIANTNDGLTGTEITKILSDSGLEDPTPQQNKRSRLYNSFVKYQNEKRCSNAILNFLSYAINPARYFGKEDLYNFRLNELNKRLSLLGLELTREPKFRRVIATTTLTEAQDRASHYKYKLEQRNVHREVFNYCNEELLKENYFHSVFEGIKSIAQRIRELTGVYADGNTLIEVVFSTAKPLIRINALETETEKSEHVGLANTIKGLFGSIRNPTAHTPKVKFIISEDEALDIMTIVSYVHKKLDKVY